MDPQTIIIGLLTEIRDELRKGSEGLKKLSEVAPKPKSGAKK